MSACTMSLSVPLTSLNHTLGMTTTELSIETLDTPFIQLKMMTQPTFMSAFMSALVSDSLISHI